jgi:hypothetical protein
MRMAKSMEELYQERMDRYWKANHMEKPDKVPFRPFAAELAGKVAGYNAQKVTHDMDYACDAVIEMCKKVPGIDAAVVNMVYVNTGVTDSYGLTYYKAPGIELEPDESFQYHEPQTEDEAFMKADEYARFIEDPNEFVMNVWIERTSKYFVPPGETNTWKNNLAWMKNGIAIQQYFGKLGANVARMRSETGTVSCLAGALKAPFDILADKFRGFRGISYDIRRRPDEVLKATEAVAPHMAWNCIATGDPEKKVPCSHWMHRGATGFFSEEIFEKFYWPSLKMVTEQIWDAGLQTIYYAEGKWGKNLKHFRDLPEKSIIFHSDKDDIYEVKKVLGDKFAISGGVQNDLLAFGEPADVKKRVKQLIEDFGPDGGYILDAEAIMQQDVKVENFIAMAEACEEYGYI